VTLGLGEYVHLVRSNRNFRLLWFAQIVSEIGDWLYAVVIYSLLLERTGSAKAVATAVILQVLPQVLIAPMAGVLNDRLSRRSLMIFADLVRAVIILGMLYATTLSSVWPIYCLLLAETLLWGIFEPGRSALLPNLVSGERETLIANTLATTTWSFNLAIGSALGGFLAVAVGVNAVFLINSASFLVSALLLVRIAAHEPHAADQPPLRWKDLLDFTPVADGFRYIGSDRRLLACLLAKSGLGIMGANYVILAIYGQRVFHLAAQPILGMSLLMGARGIGAILGPAIGSAWAGGRPPRFRTGILYGFFAASFGYLALSQIDSLPVAMACVVVAHAGGSMIWVFSTTILQTMADDRFRGRVFSADYAFLVAAMSASSWTAGVAFDAQVPIRVISFSLGALILVPAALWAFRALPLWRNDADA
jgi:predicted MFS family arabinose efflux permease